ncbi:MAG: hypothetical protein IJ519_00770 [Clostridia bacterium]|nr:hypothetical protein [Clostridia bacterium]
MAILGIILALAFFALLFICMGKEKELIGLYKATETFGRVYAFIAVDCLLTGIGAPIAMIITMFSEGSGETPISALIGAILAGVAMLAIGILMYKHAYKKCPEFLKPRCYKDLTICGLGLIIRVSLFIMMFVIETWWEFTKPQKCILDDGTEVYVYNDGTVCDLHGRWGEVKNIDGQDKVVWK